MTTNVTFYDYISLSAPPNNDRVDIDIYKATAVGDNFNETFVLSKDISKFAIPLLYDRFSQNVTLEVVSVDRCSRESPGAMIFIPGKYNYYCYCHLQKLQSTLLQSILTTLATVCYYYSQG